MIEESNWKRSHSLKACPSQVSEVDIVITPKYKKFKNYKHLKSVIGWNINKQVICADYKGVFEI